MKKLLSLFAATLIATSTLTAQTVLADYDFNDGMPSDICTYDVDRLTPSVPMQRVGFNVGKAWIILQDAGSNGNKFVGSTSQYKPKGEADDWLVLPAVHIVGTGFKLEWKSQAYQSDLRDGLKVFISTTGNQPQDFSETAVWEIEEEDAGATDSFENEFVEHSISLDDYVGEHIYIAFVNQSYDKSILGLDDIKIVRDDKFALLLDNEYIDYELDSKVIDGEIINYSMTLLDEVVIELSYNSETYSQTFSGLNLAMGKSTPFEMSHSIPLAINQTVSYSIKATAQEEIFTYNSYFTSTFHQRVVIEDHTGLWCSNCPAGIWAIDSLKHTYPNNIAPIAVQNNNGVASDIVVDAYDAGLSGAGLMSFPSGWINRTYISNPFGNAQYHFEDENSWLSLFYKCLDRIPQAGVTATGHLVGDSTIIAKAQVRTARLEENLDWRVIFVLTEDSVTGYYQNNIYTGKAEWIGGWESLPQSVSITLNDLARGIYPSFYGKEGSLPATIDEGETATYSYNIELPRVVQNTANLNLIAMVVDGKSKQVINADMVRVVQAPESVIEIQANTIAQVRVEQENIKVSAPQGEKLTASLITIDGRTLATANGVGEVNLAPLSYRGIALVHIISNGSTQVEKVIVR